MTADELKSQVALAIKANGNRDITGPVLQAELFRIIDAGYENTADAVSGSLDVDPDNILDPAFNRQNAPPATPATGDRYVVGTVPSGAWEGHADEVAEWDGAAWQFATPADGDIIYLTTPLTTLEYLESTGWRTYPGIAVKHNGQPMGSAGLRIGTRNARRMAWLTDNVERMEIGADGKLAYLEDNAPYSGLEVAPVSFLEAYVVANALTSSTNGTSDSGGVVGLGGNLTEVGTDIFITSPAEYFQIAGEGYQDGGFLYLDSYGDAGGNANVGVYTPALSSEGGMKSRDGLTLAYSILSDREAGVSWRTDALAHGAVYRVENATLGSYLTHEVDDLALSFTGAGNTGTLRYLQDPSANLLPLSVPPVSWVEAYVAANGGLGAGSGLTENAGALDVSGVLSSPVDWEIGAGQYVDIFTAGYNTEFFIEENQVFIGAQQAGAYIELYSLEDMNLQADGSLSLDSPLVFVKNDIEFLKPIVTPPTPTAGAPSAALQYYGDSDYRLCGPVEWIDIIKNGVIYSSPLFAKS